MKILGWVLRFLVGRTERRAESRLRLAIARALARDFDAMGWR